MMATLKLGLVALLAAALGFLGADFYRRMDQPAPLALTPPAPPPAPEPSWSVSANAEGAWVANREGTVFFCDRAACTRIKD